MNLKKFCCDFRESLMEPWSNGKYSYASDTAIIIRIPREDIYLENPLAPKNCEKLFPESTDTLAYFSLPDPIICDVCKNTTPKTCHECKGNGEIELSNDYNVYISECKSCNGHGKIICPACRRVTSILIEDIPFANKYIALLHQEIEKPVWIAPRGNKPAYIKFNGGDGLLCGLKL